MHIVQFPTLSNSWSHSAWHSLYIPTWSHSWSHSVWHSLYIPTWSHSWSHSVWHSLYIPTWSHSWSHSVWHSLCLPPLCWCTGGLTAQYKRPPSHQSSKAKQVFKILIFHLQKKKTACEVKWIFLDFDCVKVYSSLFTCVTCPFIKRNYNGHTVYFTTYHAS
jgi:hypothetical protein